jgi:hypothetical protein
MWTRASSYFILAVILLPLVFADVPCTLTIDKKKYDFTSLKGKE